MNIKHAIEKRDLSRIEKLNSLSDEKTFWDDVRKMTRNITSDHSIHRWEILSEIRYNEITE